MNLTLDVFLLCAFGLWAVLDILWFEATCMRIFLEAQLARARKPARCEGHNLSRTGGVLPHSQCDLCARFSWDCGFPGDGNRWIDRPSITIVDAGCPKRIRLTCLRGSPTGAPGWSCTRDMGHNGPCALVPS